jgi:hypothetical protein
MDKPALLGLTNRQEIRTAYLTLARRLKEAAQPFHNRTVGWPGGHTHVTVWWHQLERFWVTFHPSLSPSRYWIAFGLQNPKKHRTSLNITCEVNASKSGADLRSAGVLLRDSSGNELLGHTGKVGGGRAGVGKARFLQWCPNKTRPVAWKTGDRTTIKDVIVLGLVDSPSLVHSVARFIVNVDEFKQSVLSDLPDTEKLLRYEEKKAELEGKFDPDGIRDSREKNAATIVARRGQPAFRRKLLNAHGGRCAMTESDCPAALEAAHIKPYIGEATNHITNGLLLRSDLHTLFDLHLIGVSDNYKLVVSKTLMGTTYGKLAGNNLHLPKTLDADRTSKFSPSTELK